MSGNPVTCHNMKRSIIAVTCFLFLLLAMAIIIFKAFSDQARDVHINRVVQLISQQIEIFREQRRRYPDSFEELRSDASVEGGNKKVLQELISQMVHNRWNDKYSYERNDDNFTITIDSNQSWIWGTRPRIEKRFGTGQVWGNVSTITSSNAPPFPPIPTSTVSKPHAPTLAPVVPGSP